MIFITAPSDADRTQQKKSGDDFKVHLMRENSTAEEKKEFKQERRSRIPQMLSRKVKGI